MNYNNKLFFDLYNLAHKSPFFDWVFSFFAIYFPIFVLIFALLFLLMHHDILASKNSFKIFSQKIKEIFFVSLSVFLAWISSIFLKIIFHTPRPFTEFSNVAPFIRPTDYSFPSGHAALFTAVSVAIFLYHKKIGYIFMFFAFFICISRIIIGVHFPIDILGGILIGFFISYILIKSFRKI